MNLDRMTIAVRRRSLPELYDLALLVVRRHFLPLVGLALLGCAPWIALDAWLLRGLPGEGWTWYWLLLLVAVQAPLATAPITAFLGEAMFEPQPSVRRSLRTAVGAWRLLTVLGLWYGLLALCPLLLPLAPPHAVAVAVLEAQRGRAAWTRANALRSAWSSAWTLHLLLAAGLVLASLWLGIGTVNALQQLLGSAQVMPDPEELLPAFDPSRSWLPAATLFATLAYLAVVHFLAYLDLRTDREGWDIDLALRRVAARIDGHAEHAP